MYRLLPILLAALLFAADAVVAQVNFVTITCDSCRHPHQHPEDYVNHAFNQVYGPDAVQDLEILVGERSPMVGIGRLLNELGQAGWELVTYDTSTNSGVFKRPVG